MNSYEEYLEKIIELREQEISIYKNFIENELKCRIKESVDTSIEFDKNKGIHEEARYKIIEIPRSRFYVKL